jgi:MurNAc alpha-1-phosphate uridylyltransferase
MTRSTNHERLPPMGVMVLAAGRGERMRPLTDSTPKPLLCVRGKPLLQWHLETLSRHGLCDVTINVAHLGQQIMQFAGNGEPFGLRIRYAMEPENALETAGGIAAAKPWLNARGTLIDECFLAINADVWTDWPMEHAWRIRDDMHSRGSGGASAAPLCHLVLVDNPDHHPRGDFSLDPLTGLIGPRENGQSLTFSGLGVYDRQMFATIVPGTRMSLAPLLHAAVAAGRCTGEHHRGFWSDVGTPERLAALNTDPITRAPAS